MHKVLVLEDEEHIAAEIESGLAMCGFEVVCVHSIESFWGYLLKCEAQALIIDLNLPDGSGIEVIRRVRRTSDIGIIVESAISSEADRVAALELGADDYLVKPFSIRELAAKVRRLVERTGGANFSNLNAQVESGATYRLSSCSIDCGSMALIPASGDKISLTLQEFLLLKALVSSPGRVRSRENLISVTRSENWFGSDRAIDNLVSRVRKKLEKCNERDTINTIRGVGYMFSGQSAKDSHADFHY
jgi:DNA-binding response OmpR family regulator